MEYLPINKIKTWVQAVGLALFALLLTFLISPIQSFAFSPFNSSGNDGYFLSITNDPTNVRVVAVAVYDNHPKKQSSRAFVEYETGKVNYAKFDISKALPEVAGGEQGREDWVKAVRDMMGKNKDLGHDDKLGWTFPGFPGENDAKKYNASEADLDRAMWVSDTLIADFNQAISMVHNSVQKHGDGDLANISPNQFANLIVKIANAAREAQMNGQTEFSYHGAYFKVEKGIKSGQSITPPKGVPKDAYVTITLTHGKGKKELSANDKISRAFIEYVPKGYMPDPNGRKEFQPMYDLLNASFKNMVTEKGDEDIRNLTWKHIVLQSNANWSNSNVTYTNVGSITKMNKLEQAIADMTSNLLSGLRQNLGLYSSTDLIMNGGIRGTDSYYKGIMPQVWMNSVAILHWISYALAWMLIIGAIVRLLVKRNIAAINPSERVDMINSIKNLMIVGFALSIFDVAFAGIVELNYAIVKMLGNTGVNIQQFGQSPINPGFLSSIVIGFAFFVIDVYFNFYYIARALTVSILYALGPMYVASIAFGENYRQIFWNYSKELIGNIYVQSFHALLVVFYCGISIFGTLRGIETLVLLFCFIPLTRYFKESIGATSRTTDTLAGTALGATGLAVGGALAGQVMRRKDSGGGAKKGGNAFSPSTSEGGLDIKQKDSSIYSRITQNPDGTQRSTKGMIGAAAWEAGKGLASGTKGALKFGYNVAKMPMGAGLVAGGAATGIHGASQLGGVLAGSGLGNTLNSLKNGGKTVGGGVVNKVKDVYGNKKEQSRITKEQAEQDRLDTAAFMQAGIVNDRLEDAQGGLGENDSYVAGNPTVEGVYNQEDGSAIYSYDSQTFRSMSGIQSIQDVPNDDSELLIKTDFYRGTGFYDGDKTGLAGSAYESSMSEMVEAFASRDAEKIQKYRSRGIKDVQLDSSGRASIIIDRNKAGIRNTFQSGDRFNIHWDNKDQVRGTNPLKELTSPLDYEA